MVAIILPGRNGPMIGGGTGGGAFTPASLAGLVAWFQADSGVYKDAGSTPAVNNDLVQQWNDKSGNGFNLSQGTSGNRPTFKSAGFNSLAGVQWTPVDTCWMFTAAAITQLNGAGLASAWVVFSYAGISSSNRLLSMTTSTSGNDYDSTNYGVFGYFNSSTSLIGYRSGGKGSATVATGTNYRMTSIYDGTNHTMRMSNAGASVVASTGNFGNNLLLSAGIEPASKPSTGFNGTIAEIGLTSTALSGTDRSNLDTYLQTKWGL